MKITNSKNYLNTLYSIIVIALLFSTEVFGQGGNAPYSANGLGTPIFQGNIRNTAMGETGVSSGNGLYSNILNPALVQNNKLTLYAASFFGEYKENTTANSKQRDTGGNLSYFTMTFPLKKNWSMAIGLRPLTTVNYEVSSNYFRGNSQINEVTKGTGGISQFYYSNGMNVWKGLSIGLNINYNFGSIISEAIADPDAIQRFDVINLKRRTSYSKFTFTKGFAYVFKLKDKKTKVNIGGTYEKSFNYTAKQFEVVQRTTSGDIIVVADTLETTASYRVKVPATIRFGVSIEKPYKYLLALNYETQKWSDYTAGNDLKPLKDTYKISAGAEWIPNPSSVSNYFKRMTFRIGANYKKLPWIDIESKEQINEMNLTGGLSFPMGRGTSALNLAFVYGKRGMDTKNLIDETFTQIHLGLTVNQQWFIRRKIN